MTRDENRRTELAEADQALENLLGTLLSEVPEYTEPPPAAVERVATVPPVEVVPAQPTVEIARPDTEPLKEALQAPIQQVEVEPRAAVRPEWARSDFKVLVVRLGKLRLAVPLITLNAIAQLSDDMTLTGMPGQPGWHRGVTRYREGKLVVVDLAGLLKLQAGEQNPQFLLVIGDGRYGLQCDAIENPVSVQPDEVNWQALPERRRDWMYGMLGKQMCLMLDTDSIARRIG